jgi:hypothetical protein
MMDFKISTILLIVPVAIVTGLYFMMNMNFTYFVLAMIVEISMGALVAIKSNHVIKESNGYR